MFTSYGKMFKTIGLWLVLGLSAWGLLIGLIALTVTHTLVMFRVGFAVLAICSLVLGFRRWRDYQPVSRLLELSFIISGLGLAADAMGVY